MDDTVLEAYKYFLNSHTDGQAHLALEDVIKSGLSPEILDHAGVKLFNGNAKVLKERLGQVHWAGNSLLQSYRLIEFPYRNQKAEVTGYRYKLIPPGPGKDGKVVKYLHPKDGTPGPYILPEVWEISDKTNKPIYLTEGEKKCLKVSQHGRACIAFPGVWNFRSGKDSDNTESKDLWAEIKAFKWRGRRVYLAFDSDLWVNPNVRIPLYCLAFSLKLLKADVRFMIWTGAKGLDDLLCMPGQDPEQTLENLENSSKVLENFIEEGHLDEAQAALYNVGTKVDNLALDNLISIVSRSLRLPRTAIARDLKTRAREQRKAGTANGGDKRKGSLIDGCFIHEDGGVYRLISTQNSAAEVKLSNFFIQIIEDQMVDDGLEQKHQFIIEGRKGVKHLSRISLLTKDFPSLSWITDRYGNDPIIEAGQATKDHLRAYFQKLSEKEGVSYRTIYKHTGWRYINEKWIFLHAGGALGDPSVSVELDAELCRSNHYRLPDSPDREKESFGLIFDTLLNIAPPEIMLPLLAFTFLTPLKNFLNEKPGFSLFCYGQTDSFKTSVAILMQGFFGSIVKEGLANFSSTAPSTLMRIAVMGDVIVLVDDYHPSSSRKEHEKREVILDYLLRDTGNNQGRSRLNPNLSMKKTPIPKAGMIITGEMLPTIRSTLGRFVTVNFSADLINIDNLTEIQKNAELLPHAMSSFILWIADHIRDIQSDFSAHFSDLRRELFIDGKSKKLPEHAAFLVFAWRTFLQWAYDKGGLDEDLRAAYSDMGPGIFMKVCAEHATRIEEENPINLFFETVGAVITDKLARIDQVETKYEDHKGEGRAKSIGYYDDTLYYFIPSSVWHAVKEYLSREYAHFPIGKNVFYEMLEKQGYLEVTRKGQHTSTQWIGQGSAGASLRVLKVYRNKVDRMLNIGMENREE